MEVSRAVSAPRTWQGIGGFASTPPNDTPHCSISHADAATSGSAWNVSLSVTTSLMMGDRHRKTYAAFATSLVDGRLFPQAAALARSPHRPIVLLEGPTSSQCRAGADHRRWPPGPAPAGEQCRTNREEIDAS
jgi:hypothetical protein